MDLSDVVSVVDPLTKVTAGLKGTGDKPVPLRAVHIRAKLLDLAAQVFYRSVTILPEPFHETKQERKKTSSVMRISYRI